MSKLDQYSSIRDWEWYTIVEQELSSKNSIITLLFYFYYMVEMKDAKLEFNQNGKEDSLTFFIDSSLRTFEFIWIFWQLRSSLERVNLWIDWFTNKFEIFWCFFLIQNVKQVLPSIVFCFQNWWFQNSWWCLFTIFQLCIQN